MREIFRKYHETLPQKLTSLQIERHQIPPNEFSPTSADSIIFLLLFLRKTIPLQLVIFLDHDLISSFQKIRNENRKETQKNVGPVFSPYALINKFC